MEKKLLNVKEAENGCFRGGRAGEDARWRGLKLVSKPSTNHTLGHLTVEARRYTFWACFVIDSKVILEVKGLVKRDFDLPMNNCRPPSIKSYLILELEVSTRSEVVVYPA